MPQIIVKGITEEQAKNLAKETASKLGDICNCPADWFVYDYIQSKFYDETGEIAHWPVVQTWWFARPQDVQDKVAGCLNNAFKAMGYPGSQISFHIFPGESYYEDGEHY